MTPREIAKWMREEHTAIEQLINQLQDESVSIPRTGRKRWLEEMTARVQNFSGHLIRHFELEEDNGYLQAVIDHRPPLLPEIERLRHEHDEIKRILDSIQRDLGQTGEADQLVIEHCCLRIGDLLRHLKEHEERENLMVLSVFTDDLGTKD
jgi:hemerythrin-like domain-containing protein